MSATYTKLRNGDWGVRCHGGVRAGETVTVTKKDGSTRIETIARVLWTGNGIALCAVKGADTHASARPTRDGHRCRNGHAPHPGPCCSGRHGAGYDCGSDCCELD